MGERHAPEDEGGAPLIDPDIAMYRTLMSLYTNPDSLLSGWPKTVAVTGALGSGKTEWVLNLALGFHSLDEHVTIADIDIINPYFCIRQVSEKLREKGFTIITAPENAKWSDMSVVSPQVTRALGRDGRLLMDIGGDAEGALALKQFEPDIKKGGVPPHPRGERLQTPDIHRRGRGLHAPEDGGHLRAVRGRSRQQLAPYGHHHGGGCHSRTEIRMPRRPRTGTSGPVRRRVAHLAGRSGKASQARGDLRASVAPLPIYDAPVGRGGHVVQGLRLAESLFSEEGVHRVWQRDASPFLNSTARAADCVWRRVLSRCSASRRGRTPKGTAPSNSSRRGVSGAPCALCPVPMRRSRCSRTRNE